MGTTKRPKLRSGPVAGLLAGLALAGCDENGQFAPPWETGPTVSAPLPANAPGQVPQAERDVERPDIFAVTDSGLWDGRPSLGGVWVAHPDVEDPDRVVIRNTENGQTIVGALFRRERNNPGPLLQVSSDAAEALGVLAGAPTLLEVVVLRREEIPIAPPEDNPVIASLEAPVAVAAESLAPVEETPGEVDSTDAETAEDSAAETPGAGAATALAAAALAAAEVTTDALAETAGAGAEAADLTEAGAPLSAMAPAPVEPAPVDPAPEASAATVAAAGEAADAVDVSSIFTPAPLPPGSQARIGIFSVEANADAAVQTIEAAGIGAVVSTEESGGRPVWRVVAGPLSDASQITQLRTMGFVDAFILPPGLSDAAAAPVETPPIEASSEASSDG